jgi:type I restriction enzyme, S subunit
MSWQTIRISDVLIDARPGFACGEEPSDGVFQFRMNNVTAEGALNLSKKRRVPATTRNIDAFLVESGDVLFNATNSPELVGKTVFFPGHEEPIVFSNHFLRLRPHPKKLDGRFLARWLQLQFQRRVFQGMCHQWVNQATVGRESLLALTVPLPPLSDQQRIADILDRAEALRAKRRAALAQIGTITQSIFLNLFGDPFSNSKNWSITRLMNVSLAINDCPHSTPSWTTHGAICLRTSNLNKGGWNWEDTRYVSEETFAQRSSRGFLETGDIILSREGTVGIAAIVPDGLRMCMGQRLVQVRAAHDKLVPEFLLYYLLQILTQDRISQFMVGSTSQHLNVKELRNLPVPLPPLPLQREFAHSVAAVDKLKASHRASLAEMDALFASLQHRAFRGEL